MSLLDPFAFAADLIDPPNLIGWEPLPHQKSPVPPWFGWMLLGGRGTGKTETCAKEFNDHVNGPPCDPNIPGGHNPGIIAPTLGDGVTSCVKGPSGLIKFDKEVKAVQVPGGIEVRHSCGVKSKIFGAHTPEDVERLRSGGNRCLMWCEELAAWRYLAQCFQHMRYGLRIGPWPHWIASTTPKNRPLIRQLVADSERKDVPDNERIIVTHGTTDDNPHLPAHIKKMLYEDYAGTRLGQQELLGKILEDVAGALWKQVDIDLWRIPWNITPKRLDRIVVGVDPSVSEAVGDECGIIVDGMVHQWRTSHFRDLPLMDAPRGFVLADYSTQGSPKQWATRAVEAFHDWGATLIVAEKNNGGDMVKSTILNIDDEIPIKVIHTQEGKKRRAQDVAAQYEQGRWHHVGTFGRLEDQMTTWVEDDEELDSSTAKLDHQEGMDNPDEWKSPDRMDAHVYAAKELMPSTNRVRQSTVKDRRKRGRR